MLKIIMNEKALSSIGLILVGAIGFIFAPFALFIACIFAILLGVYSISKKAFDTGAILIIIGIGLIIISQFLNNIIRYVSIACILLGVGMFIYFVMIKKQPDKKEPGQTPPKS